MPGSAPGEARLSKTVREHEDTPREGAFGTGVEMCLNTGEGTARQSPGHVEAQQNSNGKQLDPLLASRLGPHCSSHNEGAAPVLLGPDGEAGEVRGLRTRPWVEVLVMHSGVQRGEPVGLVSLGKVSRR